MATIQAILDWRKANPERVKATSKKYYWNHPDKSLFRNARVRARELRIPFSITADDIGPLPAACPLCDGPVAQSRGKLNRHSPTLDRIVPAVGYVSGNIWIICHGCNRQKAEMTVERLRDLADRIERRLCAK